jgi:PAS domain S-box-containing protein
MGRERKITHVNQRACELLRYTREQLIGLKAELLFGHFDLKELEFFTTRLLAGEKLIDTRTMYRGDGSAFVCEASLSFIPEDLVCAVLRDVSDRIQMEKKILEVSTEERRQMGKDLHDSLGQHLTGISLLSSALERDLHKTSPDLADKAAHISEHIREAIRETRNIAQGVSPVPAGDDGLRCALVRLASDIEKRFEISCVFEPLDEALVNDNSKAVHLYHIAQEAVTNAIKHGMSKNISIRLSTASEQNLLLIEDDGKWLQRKEPGYSGQGVHIMQYRAEMIDGFLTITKNTSGGTIITCHF